jgi:hypothetical protein
MPQVQERLTDVEYHLAQLAHAQLKTEMALQELSRDMSDFKAEMSDFKAEMSDFKAEMSDFKTEMSDFKTEMAADRKRMNKAWGDLANKLGTIIEDIVAPNIRRLASERFACEPLEFFSVLLNRRGPDGVMREFDVLAMGAGRVVLTESKSTVTAEAVAQFAEKVAAFFDHFPEWRICTLIPVLASWRIPEPAHRALTAARIYGLEMGEETMRLVNDGEF